MTVLESASLITRIANSINSDLEKVSKDEDVTKAKGKMELLLGELGILRSGLAEAYKDNAESEPENKGWVDTPDDFIEEV